MFLLVPNSPLPLLGQSTRSLSVFSVTSSVHFFVQVQARRCWGLGSGSFVQFGFRLCIPCTRYQICMFPLLSLSWPFLHFQKHLAQFAAVFWIIQANVSVDLPTKPIGKLQHLCCHVLHVSSYSLEGFHFFQSQIVASSFEYLVHILFS